MWSADIPLNPHYVAAPFKHLPTRHSNPITDEEIYDEEIVGFGIDKEKIIQCLIRGTNDLDVVPIVGMGGQGKTTIARKVYNSDNIVSHFDVRAWCIVSQTYNRRKLLQEILSKVTGSTDKGYEDDILADELRKSLMGKRYLIVLDDMWDCMAWDDLRLSFPDSGNRSRIVVTTRIEKVGEQVKFHTDPFSLPFLTKEESCELLQKKVFQKEDCPPELQDVSQVVAEKCKGLPLVIVLVAGIIKKRKMEESWWNELKDSLFDYLDCHSEQYSRATMQLSFDNLADCLKPCLLYMGMFLEDASIKVSALLSLWIAEDFVQNIESAEDYLMNLISSNVVMVSKKEYNGKIKYCKVHDVVLHFCLEKSREENFMLVAKGNHSQFQSFVWKQSRVSFSLSEENSKFASKTRKCSHQPLRSLIMNEPSFYIISLSSCIHNLRLLKVLVLNSNEVDYVNSATLKPLNHLKYLGVSASKFYFDRESHPPHLETLIVQNNRSVMLSGCFWEMEQLRHVEISDAEFDKQGLFEGSSKLENLRILKNIVRFPIDRADVLSRRCPNLQQLQITYFGNDEEPFTPKFENLTQLQQLQLSFASPCTLSGLQLPSNLIKLALEGIHIESVIPFIAGLPSLEYLRLQDVCFPQSEEWCLGDITFPKLKLLKLVNLPISRWDVSEESFPLLETLVIKKCDDLEEIPLSFADIPTLEQIKLIGSWKVSLEDSAMRMKEEIKEIEGCDRLHLVKQR